MSTALGKHSSNTRGRRSRPPREYSKENVLNVDGENQLIVPINSFLMYNKNLEKGRQKINSSNTYISGSSSEFRKDGTASSASMGNASLNMDYSVSTATLSNTLTYSVSQKEIDYTNLYPDGYLRSQYEQSVNFLALLGDEDVDDENSLVVLTEDIDTCDKKKSGSDANSSNLARFSDLDFSEDNKYLFEEKTASYVRTESETKSDCVYGEDELMIWRPIHDYKQSTPFEVLFDLTNLNIPIVMPISSDANDVPEIHSAMHKNVITESIGDVGANICSGQPDGNGTHVKGNRLDNSSKRDGYRMPPLHPSSYMRQRNKVIVEYCDYTQKDSSSTNEKIEASVEDRLATRIQRVYRGWKCRLHIMQKMGVAKRRHYEKRTNSWQISRIHSNIRREARCLLRLHFDKLKNPSQFKNQNVKTTSSMVLAVRAICAKIIQRWFRSFRYRLCHQRGSDIWRRQNASVIIQKAWRGTYYEQKYFQELLGVIQIQALTRGYLVRRRK
mmetsp:Transcript_17953/g.23244  ORF Transcript_17953/g.23244 Transcript_17953/m.23244 type:complete len:500 (-) Transcript_17953:2369-3868(-)